MIALESFAQAATQLAVILSVITWTERLFFIAAYWVLSSLSIPPRSHPTSNARHSGTNRHSNVSDHINAAKYRHCKVVIQLPMCNEGIVCCGAIDASANLRWPADNLIIRVLDDSTDGTTRDLIDAKVKEWEARGLNIECLRRSDKTGYKAGNLRNVSLLPNIESHNII